jgi:hypothetical protein
MSGFTPVAGLLAERPDLSIFQSVPTCGTTPRPGALSRSRKQRGGACRSCILGSRQRGGSKKKSKSKSKTRKSKIRKSKKQKGGASFFLNPLAPTVGDKALEVSTLPCQTAFTTPKMRQRGGQAELSVFNSPLAGQLSPSPLALEVPTAGFTFDMTGSSKLADLKIPYPEVISVPARTRRLSRLSRR